MTDKNLGHATAYGYAKSKGYTGTEEEFAELMASYAEVAESAKGYAEQAEASATNAETSASNAQTSATSASTSASSASASAQTASTKASEASDSATSASESASTAVSAKDDAVTAKEEAETAKADAETAAEEAQESAQTVANKADKDGTYPDMTVGGVMSSDGSTDSTPYLYRASGGGVEVGTVEEDSIVGGTVAFNQLAEKYTSGATTNGVTFTPNADGSVSVNGTASTYAIQYVPNQDRVTAIVGHKYFACGCPSGGSANTWQLSIRVNSGGTIVGNDYGSGVLFAFTASTANDRFSILMRVVTGATINAKFIPQLFDLTQMFGSTVADYIYSLEQSSTGAGVSYFRKLFPKDYYEYNTGELKSVEGLQSHDMVGFNQWDEEWELGLYNESTGVAISGSENVRSKNYIPVVGGQSYYFNAPQNIVKLAYDADKNYIGKVDSDTKNVALTMPNNCAYIKFYMYKAYGTAYNHDICLNISSDRNGEYEPYIKHSYPLDSSLTLRGIPKLDTSNNLYYDGDVYSADGKVQRKYRVVDLGNLDWVNENTRFYTRDLVSLISKKEGSLNLISTQFIATDRLDFVYNNEKGYMFLSGAGNLSVTKNGYTTTSEFQTAMSGVYLVYELATPTEETAQPFTEYQKVSKYGTEEYVSTGIVPVGHVTKYLTDIVSKVDGLPLDFSTLIAPTEKGFTATRAYTVNQFIIIKNQLYRVTASIANGATITVGTNVVAITVAEILTQLLGV